MQAVRINPRSGQPPTDTQRRGRKTIVKRVLYLVVATLVAMVILLPPAMAQGEQAQEWVQQAQEKVQEAQAHLESPEGQQALQDTWVSLEEARTSLQQPQQQGEQARENAQQALQQAQDRVEQARQYMQSPEGQQALEEARAILQQALQQMQGAVQEKKQEVTAKIETTKGLPSSGGAEVGALVAPAAALLVGGAVLGYAVLRRR
jgi:predicted metal-dependent hydrolase